MLSIGWVRRLALAGGILLPLAETVRRSANLVAWWLWIDDWLIGAVLLAGWWASRTGTPAGLRGLTAAWSFAAGMGYYGLTGHLARIGERDVSGLSGAIVTFAVGGMWVLALWASASAIRARR